jgi:hypothetical protein
MFETIWRVCLDCPGAQDQQDEITGDEPMERHRIRKLFLQLDKQEKRRFPKPGQSVEAPRTHGVYVIRNLPGNVLHVGRSHRGYSGLKQRLYDHLQGRSSFVDEYLQGQGSRLRKGYTFQYLEVPIDRERALLEHFATAWYCPKHLGLGSG